MKKILSLILALVLPSLLIQGCTETDGAVSDSVRGEKTVISIGGWPTESDTEMRREYDELIRRFNKIYPEIEIVPDEWGFSINTFLPRAVNGQLPTLYVTAFTEIQNIINAGYAADISEYAERDGYTKSVRSDILDLVSNDGHVYAIPEYSYIMGLYMNKKLFKEAGEINPDGTLKIPATWEELAKTAQRITQKTGKAGFIMPTVANQGGWHFLNIAWGFGVDKQFMKNENGKWTVTFDSAEGAAALQYVKDLKWKYNTLPAEKVIDSSNAWEMFAKGEAAMFLAAPPVNSLTDVYGMNKDDIAVASMPAGPAGKFTQMGGTIRVIKPDATEAEIDACFKWMDFIGMSPRLTEDAKISIENQYKLDREMGRVVGIMPYTYWKESESEEYTAQMVKKYTNTDVSSFEDFHNLDRVTVNPEPPISCQQLYSIIDTCIQTVLNDKNADPQKVISEAAKEFQINYLDRSE